jgi:hypothetical protein
MGGFKSAKAYKARPRTRGPQRLKGARDTYVKRTGGKLRPVHQAGLYKDFTDFEKRQYASLIAEPKTKLGKKTLLGG